MGRRISTRERDDVETGSVKVDAVVGPVIFASASRWKKKDIKTLCSQLDSYWLTRRPGMTLSEETTAAEQFRKVVVGRARREVVLAGLRAARETSAERYRKDCESISNAIVRDVWGASREEMIERFTKSAREEDAAHKILEALVLRVHHEGLPPEVDDYDPTKR